MAAGPIAERNQDATTYVGGLDEKVNESILWELFLQSGPVVNVHMPKDRITQQHMGYGFVEFLTEEDADYAIKVLNMIKLYGKPIRVNKASAHQKNLDVGANIFIGNLDPEIDEKYLYDTFSAFGVILQTPKIMRDPDSGNSKGYAFINFASFEASDASIDAMNGQYLYNRPITVSYAFKKDSKGDRHGTAAERLLAAQNPLSQADRPHQLFADAPPSMDVLESMSLGMLAHSAMVPPPPPPNMPGMPPMMPPPNMMMPPPPSTPNSSDSMGVPQPGSYPSGPPPSGPVPPPGMSHMPPPMMPPGMGGMPPHMHPPPSHDQWSNESSMGMSHMPPPPHMGDGHGQMNYRMRASHPMHRGRGMPMRGMPPRGMMRPPMMPRQGGPPPMSSPMNWSDQNT